MRGARGAPGDMGSGGWTHAAGTPLSDSLSQAAGDVRPCDQLEPRSGRAPGRSRDRPGPRESAEESGHRGQRWPGREAPTAAATGAPTMAWLPSLSGLQWGPAGRTEALCSPAVASGPRDGPEPRGSPAGWQSCPRRRCFRVDAGPADLSAEACSEFETDSERRDPSRCSPGSESLFPGPGPGAGRGRAQSGGLAQRQPGRRQLRPAFPGRAGPAAIPGRLGNHGLSFESL